MKAFKLFSQHRDGIGPLFINRRLRIPLGVWLPAEDHPTKGYAHRPGWHVTSGPHAPHLSPVGRVWYRVEVRDFVTLQRPASQGGTWYLAKQMRVIGVAP